MPSGDHMRSSSLYKISLLWVTWKSPDPSAFIRNTAGIPFIRWEINAIWPEVRSCGVGVGSFVELDAGVMVIVEVGLVVSVGRVLLVGVVVAEGKTLPTNVEVTGIFST